MVPALNMGISWYLCEISGGIYVFWNDYAFENSRKKMWNFLTSENSRISGVFC